MNYQKKIYTKFPDYYTSYGRTNELPRSRAARYLVGKVLSPVHPHSKLRGILRQNKATIPALADYFKTQRANVKIIAGAKAKYKLF